MKKIVLLGVIFVGVLCVVHVSSLVFLSKNYFESVFIHRESFTDSVLAGSSYFDMAFTHFFGAPLFFPQLMNYTAYGSTLQYIIEGYYAFWWQYLFVAAIVLMLVLSLVKNYKNPFVQMIFLLFVVDITIHCIFKFGIDQPFIYGAHWIYCIPLLLGWLYNKLKGYQEKVFMGVVACMFIGLIVNNLYRLSDFINLAQQLYPVQ